MTELLYIGSATVAVFVYALLVAGIVWSPFAALVCALVARFRGLSIPRYTVAGAVYSALLLLPWVSLLALMYGRSIPRSLATMVYILLYGVWIFASMIGTLTFISTDHGETIDLGPIGVSLTMVFVISLIVNASTWIGSLTWLIRVDTYPYDREQKGEALASSAYLQPFALAAVWIILPWFVLFTTIDT